MLKPYDHHSRYECNKISEEQRMTLFTKFYEIKTYDLQKLYLASCGSKTSVKRDNKQAVSQKHFATILRLMNFRVCKEYFLKSFDITNRRLRIVCQKKTFAGITEPDIRGSHTPANKISPQIRNDVISHIKMFPRYKSHYSRARNSNTGYLREDLNIKNVLSVYRMVHRNQ